jgi:hypothetical protein
MNKPGHRRFMNPDQLLSSSGPDAWPLSLMPELATADRVLGRCASRRYAALRAEPVSRLGAVARLPLSQGDGR